MLSILQNLQIPLLPSTWENFGFIYTHTHDKNHREGKRNGSRRCVYTIITTDKQIFYVFLRKAELFVNKSRIYLLGFNWVLEPSITISNLKKYLQKRIRNCENKTYCMKASSSYCMYTCHAASTSAGACHSMSIILFFIFAINYFLNKFLIILIIAKHFQQLRT